VRIRATLDLMPMLSKDQRNRIYRTIASTKLDLTECDLTSTSKGGVEITHNPSGSAFKVERERLLPVLLSVKSKVGDNREIWRTLLPLFTWVVSDVRIWANGVYKWMQVPDLWENSHGYGGIPGESTPDSANTPFTPDEQAYISAKLLAIAEDVKQSGDLTAEQWVKVKETFEEAAKATERMTRKDWGMFFGGVVLSLVLPDIITPEAMRHVFMLVEHGIGHLFSVAPVSGVLSAGQD
jgi:hypothetical protein